MADLWAAFLVSFGVVFVAELGDKSQLLAMTFATRYRAWQVLVGISAATVVVHLLSVAVGHGVGSALPAALMSLLAGLGFVGFAAWTWRGDALGDGDRRRARRTTRSAVVAIATAFLLAELGDKTMLATVTLAVQYDWAGVWIGSTVGMVAADALAITAGWVLGRRLPERVMRSGATALFLAFGSWFLVDGVRRLL